MWLTFLIIAQVALIPLAGVAAKFQRLGMFTAFYGVFFILLVVPFYLIALDIHGVVNLIELIGRTSDAKVTLPLGSGFRPIACICAFQTCYLLGGIFVALGSKACPLPLQRMHIDSNYRLLAIWLFVGSLAYVVVRFIVVPDFPLFVMLTTGNWRIALRDLSYEYASKTNVPYLFRPSINANVMRIITPLSAFMLLTFAKTNRRYRGFLVNVSLCTAFVFVVGQFKRAPLCYLSLWYLMQHFYGTSLKHVRKLFVVFIVLVFVMIGITAAYQTMEVNWTQAASALIWRLMIGEAIGEFLAIEHFGTSFEYLQFDIAARYLQKIQGQDVMTFSEYWKLESGGKRGYTSIGIMAEVFCSFGPLLSIVAFLAIGAILAWLDRLMWSWDSMRNRPFIAGLTCVIAFMAVKGFFSQMFARGGLMVIMVFALMTYFCASSASPKGASLRRLRPGKE